MGILASKPKQSGNSSSNASAQPALSPATTTIVRADAPVTGSTTSGSGSSSANAGVKGGVPQRRVSSSVKTATAIKRAIEERNVQKLKIALNSHKYRGWPQLTVLGGQLSSSSTSSGGNQPQQASSSSPPPPVSDRSLSLLEYAVEKNFTDGVEVLIKSMSNPSLKYHSDKLVRETATAAFLRSCDSCESADGRLKIFNMFIESAINGRLQIDLHAAFIRFVDRRMFSKPFDLACKPYFELVTLPDNLCRITPLGLAVMQADTAAIEQFVQRGADIDAYDREGNTALLRAGYSQKAKCFATLLLLGADPNRRSRQTTAEFFQGCAPPSSLLPFEMTTSPLISVFMTSEYTNRTRSTLIGTLVSCGLNASHDREWFASAFGVHQATFAGGVNRFSPDLYKALVERVDEETRRIVFELCSRPPTLQNMCCQAIRKRVARRIDMGEMQRKVDLLPLPTAIKARLRLMHGAYKNWY